jgi:hypothetical protein
LGADFILEADVWEADFNMEADVGRVRFPIWRRMSEEHGGVFQYGGGFAYGGGSRGRVCSLRRITGAGLLMEADDGGGFQYGGLFHYGGGFVLRGGGLSFLII